MTPRSPSPSEQLLHEQSLVHDTPVKVEQEEEEDPSPSSIMEMDYTSAYGVYEVDDPPLIKNRIELTLSRSWLRTIAPVEFFHYLTTEPLPIALGSPNAMTPDRLRRMYPQLTAALVIQAYGTPTPSPCHRCSAGSGLKQVFQLCATLDDVAHGACGNCVVQHANIRCEYYTSFTPSGTIIPSVERGAPSPARSWVGRSVRVTRTQSRENSAALAAPYALPPLRRSAVRRSAGSRRRSGSETRSEARLENGTRCRRL